MRPDTRQRKHAMAGLRAIAGQDRMLGTLVRVISSGKQALDAVMLEMGRTVAQSVLLIAAAAPVGSSTIAIAHREHLDVGFAAATASLSALLAVFWLPLVLTVVRP